MRAPTPHDVDSRSAPSELEHPFVQKRASNRRQIPPDGQGRGRIDENATPGPSCGAGRRLPGAAEIGKASVYRLRAFFLHQALDCDGSGHEANGRLAGRQLSFCASQPVQKPVIAARRASAATMAARTAPTTGSPRLKRGRRTSSSGPSQRRFLTGSSAAVQAGTRSKRPSEAQLPQQEVTSDTPRNISGAGCLALLSRGRWGRLVPRDLSRRESHPASHRKGPVFASPSEAPRLPTGDSGAPDRALRGGWADLRERVEQERPGGVGERLRPLSFAVHLPTEATT